MQTILGANGQIAQQLAKELCKDHTKHIRLVSRNPQRVNPSDQLHPANLLDQEATSDAVAGSEIAYLTVGLPMDSKLWEDQFPVMMQNTINACKQHDTKLVFFDNTYMYPKTSEPQTEATEFLPNGRKSTVRAEIATMLQTEMNTNNIQAVICRAPEFYGPGKTQSLTNTMVFDRIRQGKKIRVPINDDTLRSLIWTPDASRAMALIGNSPEAYGHTWHLPCDDNRLTYKSLIDLASKILNKDLEYSIVPALAFTIGGVFNKQMREVKELLPRYEQDNIFDSSKFKQAFPAFQITPVETGIREIMLPQG